MYRKYFLFLCLQLSMVIVLGQNEKHIMVAAHRGDWRNAPENSLRAFTNAAAMGVDIVEIDLQLTKDSVLVILHDKTLDRTTNGKGKPGDFTLQEIKQLRLKNGLGRLTNHQVPTLEEVMKALKGTLIVNLDKSDDFFREAYQVLLKTGTLQQAIFKSTTPYPDLKKKYTSLLDSIIYMPVIDLCKPMARENIDLYLANMKPYAFELNFSCDSSSILNNNRFITANGPRIWMNSLWPSLNAGHDDDKAVEEGNTTDSWDWLIAHGATIIQTDRPVELILYLRKKGLRKQ